MCTVTYIPAGDGAFITSNRDEQRGRTPALAPSLYPMTTGRILFPKDSQAGGTWFAVHENGNILVLLNGAKHRHQPAPPYRKSRGLILLELADSDQPLHRFSTTDLREIEPFTLVLQTAGQLHECCWDGSRKYHSRADASLPHIWSSVTLYDAATIARRKTLFEEWLRANPSPDQEKILHFHQFAGDSGASHPSIQLFAAPSDDLPADPGSQVLTVSITSCIPAQRTLHCAISTSRATALQRNASYSGTQPWNRHELAPAPGLPALHYKTFPLGILELQHRLYPIYIVWVILCIRARSFFFFAASNPAIKNGGFLNESKKDISPLIPASFLPKTLFFSLPANADLIIHQLQSSGFSYPLIGKPDIGGRGRGVKALGNDEELRTYIRTAFVDFHIQEFVSYKNEVGIFYYRYPGEKQGRLSGIVRKEFLAVTGDGRSRISELLRKEKRAVLQLKNLEQAYGPFLETILPASEERILVPYGNHARGARFVDDSHLIDEQLTLAIDGICRQIPQFYFGRLDIRYHSWEELRQGKNFAIIEVNGAGSEPTHIYDHSLLFAWKEIIRHWIILWRISRSNHRLGFPYLTVREGIRMFREDKAWSQKLAAMSE